MAGLVKTVVKEWPEVRAHWVDLNTAEPATELAAYLELELLAENPLTEVAYNNGARQVIDIVKTQFPERDLVGVFELHTYSSLNKDFFSRYADTLKYCNSVIVYYNPKAVAQKKLGSFEPEDVVKAFNHHKIKVINKSEELGIALAEIELVNRNVLLMSSANFGGLDLKSIF